MEPAASRPAVEDGEPGHRAGGGGVQARRESGRAGFGTTMNTARLAEKLLFNLIFIKTARDGVAR
jgi:hypothetical protein